MPKPDYVCTKCGGHQFEITVAQNILVGFYEDGEHNVIDGPFGDLEFDGDSHANCTNCGERGYLCKFKPLKANP